MNNAKRITIGFLAATLIIGAFAGVSLAASENATAPAKSIVDGCRGFFGGAAEQLATLLGLKPEQIVEKRNAGESLADIAKDQGVPEDKVVDTILEERKKFLDEKVKAGVITKDQADAMLERMKTRIQQRIQDTNTGGCCGTGQGGYGRRGGAGMRGGGCGGGVCPQGGSNPAQGNSQGTGGSATIAPYGATNI